MKAILSIAAGGPETLVIGELPDPVAEAGELLIAIKACAINYPDVLIIEDKYQFRPQRPFAPGSEIAGIVEAVGEGVTGWGVGDRVVATTMSGGLAEKIALPAERVFPLPEAHGFEEGAGLLFTYATVIHALADRGGLRAGETLLVLGAAGGIGLAAIELGKAFGARIVAAVSSEEKAAAPRDAGADEVVIYGPGPLDRDASRALADRFKAAVGDEGADIILDPVGGDYAEPALRSIAWEGRYLVVGFPAGIPRLPFNLALLKSCDIRGVFWGAFAERNPHANRANVARLFELWAEGRIDPRITRIFPFAQASEAIALLASRGAIGKLVVAIG